MFNSRRDFDLVIKKAGIPKKDALGQKVTAHSFRHTYATVMAEAIGHNAFLLKEILGHKRLSTTEGYCHPTAPMMPIELPKKLKGQGDVYVGPVCGIEEIRREEAS